MYIDANECECNRVLRRTPSPCPLPLKGARVRIGIALQQVPPSRRGDGSAFDVNQCQSMQREVAIFR